jgi:hypothetical protein
MAGQRFEGRREVLSRARRPGQGRWLLAALVLPLLAAGLVVLAAPAQAEDCDPYYDSSQRRLVYPCQRAGNETPGRGGEDPVNVGNKTKPSCNLVPPATFCVGGAACYIKDSVVPFLPPKGPPPKPDAQWVVRMCVNADGAAGGEAIWLDDNLPVEPPLIVQAQEAVGQLQLPKLGMRRNPRGVSITNLETIFTPTGATDEPLRGSSAFGLVAIATFDTWTVKPGDGDTVTCNPPRSCRHTYERSSVGQDRHDDDGNPAYAVRSYGTWTIQYEQGGDPITIPGAQTTIVGPVTTVPVAVAEVQSVVTDG